MKKFLLSFLLFLTIALPAATSQSAFVEFPVEKTGTEQKSGVSYFNDISSVFSFVMALVFILSLFGLLFSGIKFMVAGGNEKALGEARTYLISSSVGVVISLVGYISLNLLKHFF